MLFNLQDFLIIGMESVSQKMITEEDTARHFGSGSLGHLLATPAFVSMIIDASANAIEHRLPPGMTTVGRHMEITHDKPTCLGMMVRIKAVLKKIDGDRLYFDIFASDDAGIIGYGTHERTVVNRDQLFAKANHRLLNK